MDDQAKLPQSAPAARFSCPACGKRFAWQDAYAGRKVTCKCGATFVAALGGTVRVDQPVLMSDRDEIHAEPRGRAVQLPPGYAFPRMRRPAHDMASDDDDASPFRDFYFPMLLLVIGAIGRLMQMVHFTSTHSLTIGHAIALLVCELLICGAAMFAGVLAAAHILGTSFGEPKQIALKFAGMALFVAAAGYLLASIDTDRYSVRGALLAWHLVFILYFIFFRVLFSLELSESIVTVVIVFLLQLVLLFAAARGMSAEAARAIFFGN
ncbi:hypothetical protein BH09PLA1_BH09PLA1_00660 [soil metagenome]